MRYEKELKRDRDEWRIAAIVLMALFIILAILYLCAINQTHINKEQLEVCQRNTTIWTLKYNCDWSAIGKNFTAHYEFENYDDYLEQLDFSKNILKCKIIS